ncbi:type III CRISPR-associated RAMP protein Csx7 [Desulfobacca acetoxidans]|uniref:CRISPR-associated RAMP protein, SSO1426 family n=1 Tax=Desulfobacca acetoxidans (strain ATCC 700848 / DSM 11109 / ASRB2) TaxID=880072 RepID=F2NE34_DESAR|nr:CRISPR-associated RAMP protein Csx7 [Desulfobacca acetoxidans]AEB10602.1 CRISPR-associated RAMP protein, SSO1426 family [Desulfobacca acetoxidans DSM 11109]
MITFEKMYNRYHLTGTLMLNQAAHIGSGAGNDEIDSLFICDHQGRHFIPGSSLRGALRSTVERVIGVLLKNGSCCLDPMSDLACPSGNRAKQEKMNEFVGKNKETEICQKIATDLCPTCQIFGSPFLSSRVRLADLFPQNNCHPQGQKRFGVAIDRDTETAAKGLLFTYQVVEAGEKFDFELWAENMTDDNWGVLAIGLLEMISGHFWLGGKKNTSGLGQCQLREDSLKLEYFDGSSGLKHYLLKQAWPVIKNGGQVKAFLTEKVKNLLEKAAA